jgi:hypothetical protein
VFGISALQTTAVQTRASVQSQASQQQPRKRREDDAEPSSPLEPPSKKRSRAFAVSDSSSSGGSSGGSSFSFPVLPSAPDLATPMNKLFPAARTPNGLQGGLWEPSTSGRPGSGQVLKALTGAAVRPEARSLITAIDCYH